MSSSDDADLAILERVTDDLSTLLTSIDDDQRGLPTPCPDWDLTALLDHVAGGNWFTDEILAGKTADDALADTMKRFAGGPATLEEVASSAGDQLAAFTRGSVLEKTWHHMAGDLTGRQILHIRLHDLIVHTWDIEQSTDPPATVPDDLVKWGLSELSRNDSKVPQLFGLEAFTPGNGSDGRTYLNSFGR